MLKKRLIPLILYDDWKMVKTINFTDIRNYGSPVVAAKTYDAQKVDEIIFLDIRASLNHREPPFDAAKDIISSCFCPVSVGGGINTISHIRRLLNIGADKVIINTGAVKRPEFIREASNYFGSSCIVVAIDIMKIKGFGYFVYILSGEKVVNLYPINWAKKCEYLGAGEIFINSIDRDGRECGYDNWILKMITNAVDIPVIASGGAGHPQHFVDVINKTGVDAVAAGSIFLYTEHSPMSARKYMLERGINVRPYEESKYGIL